LNQNSRYAIGIRRFIRNHAKKTIYSGGNMSFIEIDTALKYRVADLSLAEWGTKEMDLAKNEMPGLMAVRKKYGRKKPLKGMKITGSLHMTIQTAMLIETLKEPGADIRWAS